MNTTPRSSLVALLALIPILVVTGCGTPTAGVASPAGTTSSSTAAAAPSVPNSAPTTQPPAESSTTSPESTEPGSQEPGSQQPGSEQPSSQAPEPSGPAVLPTDLSGEVYGFIRGVDVDRSRLTLDKIDWFTGAAAARACTEDAVPQEAHLDGWCSVYYFRNVNPALRVVTVSPDAVVTTLDGNTPVSSDLEALADLGSTQAALYRPYRLVVTDGAVTQLTETYQP